MDRRTPCLLIASLAAVASVAAWTAPAGALDRKPTKLASLAKALGIKKAGPHYRYREKEATAQGRLTVDVPTAWSDIADSQFRRPATNEPYGVGLRATTDAQRWHETFDVPGYRVTATGEVPADPGSLVDANAGSYESCRALGVKPFDNGKYRGSYEVFARCEGTRTAGIVVSASDERGSALVVVVGTAVTKADLKAFDRALSSATLEKTSV